MIYPQDSDISKREQDILQSNKERFIFFVENAMDCIWELDTKGVYIYANQRHKEVLGYEPAEMIGKSIFDFMPLENVAEQRKAWERFVKAQKPFERNENTAISKDGHQVIFRSYGVPFFNNTGKLIGFRGSDHDITDVKLLEKELREKESRFRALTESTSDCVWEVDTNDIHIYVNPRYKEILGYDSDEMIGRSAFDFMDPNEAVRQKDNWQRIVDACKSFERVNNVMLHKDGHQVIFESNGVPVFNSEGKIIGFRGIDRDITSRVLSEEARRSSENKFTKVFQCAPDPIAISTFEDGRFIEVNESFIKATGYKYNDILGRTPSELKLWNEEEIYKKITKASCDNRLIRNFKIAFINKQGIHRSGLMSAEVIELAGKQCMIVAYKDTTQENRLREDMEFYVREITQIQENERKRIARELHDETAAGLATIKINIQNLMASGEVSADLIIELKALKEYVSTIADGVRRFSQKLRPVLLEELGLVASLKSLCHDLESSHQAIKCHVTVKGSERRLPPDTELMMFRIAQEGINNIIKHSAANKMILVVDFSKRHVNLNIIDDGKGFRLPNTISELARDGRVGLIGIQERINLLGGRFNIESEPNKGTIISAKIPI